MSMSLTGGYQWGENNLANSIVRRGVTLVTASGNDRRNACYYSPGSAGLNINVGGHGYTARDCKKPMYYYSNYGNCVHIVAPGVQVLSADYRNTYRKYIQVKIYLQLGSLIGNPTGSEILFIIQRLLSKRTDFIQFVWEQ